MCPDVMPVAFQPMPRHGPAAAKPSLAGLTLTQKAVAPLIFH